MVMKANCPRHIIFQNRGLNYAGPGRAAGSHAYIDPGSGAVHDLFCVEVVQVGLHFGLARVANNLGMSTVRVRLDHSLLNGAGPLTVGQVLLAGPLSPEAAGPRALGAWPLDIRVPRPRSNGERRGFIHSLHAGFGFVQPADGGPTIFFHFSQYQRGLIPQVGAAVKYIPMQGPRGMAATSVRSA
jgi:cold shock CspA family protein